MTDSSYKKAMNRLAKSGDLAADTFYRAMASMTVQSAIEPLQNQESRNRNHKNDKFLTRESKKNNKVPNTSLDDDGCYDSDNSDLTDVEIFCTTTKTQPTTVVGTIRKPKHQGPRSSQAYGRDKPDRKPDGCTSFTGTDESPDEEENDPVCFMYICEEEVDDEEDGADCKTDATGYASNTVFNSDHRSSANSYKKDGSFSHSQRHMASSQRQMASFQRQMSSSQKQMSCVMSSKLQNGGVDHKPKSRPNIDRCMKLMAYHMDRISCECESYFQEVPLSGMSRADKRHCRRFHKGLIGKKKAGERRKADQDF